MWRAGGGHGAGFGMTDSEHCEILFLTAVEAMSVVDTRQEIWARRKRSRK